MLRRFMLYVFGPMLLGGVALGAAQEKAVLNAPVAKNLTITDYQVYRVTLQRAADLPNGRRLGWEVEIRYADNLGDDYTDAHADDATAQALVVGFVKAIRSGQNPDPYWLNHLIAEGKISAATVK
jgi:hypothetical protein